MKNNGNKTTGGVQDHNGLERATEPSEVSVEKTDENEALGEKNDLEKSLIKKNGFYDEEKPECNNPKIDNRKIKILPEIFGLAIAYLSLFVTYHAAYVDSLGDYERMGLILLGVAFILFILIAGWIIIKCKKIYNFNIIPFIFLVVPFLFAISFGVHYVRLGRLDPNKTEPTISVEQTEETQEPSESITPSVAEVVKETDNLDIETPTPSPEFETEPPIIVRTETSTSEPSTTTPTPAQAGTTIATETHETSDPVIEKEITIGLIDLDEFFDCSLNPDIKPYLEELEFTVETISLNLELPILAQFDVVYLPHGWYCAEDDIEARATYLQMYTREYGGGLLIGNPFSDTSIYRQTIFSELIYQSLDEPDDVSVFNTSHYLTSNRDLGSFPLPEVQLYVHDSSFLQLLAYGNNSNSYSILVYDEHEDKINGYTNKGRAVILAGGDVPGSDNQFQYKDMRRIIRWLAKDLDYEFLIENPQD